MTIVEVRRAIAERYADEIGPCPIAFDECRACRRLADERDAVLAAIAALEDEVEELRWRIRESAR